MHVRLDKQDEDYIKQRAKEETRTDHLQVKHFIKLGIKCDKEQKN